MHHVQKYTRVILPHAALYVAIIYNKLHCKMYNYIYVNALIPMYRVLKLGVHITVTICEFSYLVTAVETLTPERLKALRVLGGQP